MPPREHEQLAPSEYNHRVSRVVRGQIIMPPREHEQLAPSEYNHRVSRVVRGQIIMPPREHEQLAPCDCPSAAAGKGKLLSKIYCRPGNSTLLITLIVLSIYLLQSVQNVTDSLQTSLVRLWSYILTLLVCAGIINNLYWYNK